MNSMTSTLQKLTVTTSLALSLCALNATQAQALSLYDFTVTPDFGTLTGNTYQGNFSFDDSGLTSSGEEEVALLSFNFLNFLGRTYTQADDPSAIASFFDGNFLGIDYFFSDTDVTFSFLSGVLTQDINDAFFSYDITAAPMSAGTGNIAYTAVPTPALLPGLVGLGAALVRRKRRGEADQST
jgi:hypothetical protein